MTMQYAHGSFTWGSGDSVGTTYTCSPGFQAQLIRVWCMGLDSGTDAASQTVHLVRSMGYATGTSNRFCVGAFSRDASAAADCSVALMDNCVLVMTAGSTTITGALDLDSISSTSFNLINDNAPDQNITVFWEAWNDSVSGFTMWAGGFSAPGATGDQTFTGLTGLESGNPDGDQLLVCFSKQATAVVNQGAANDSGIGVGWATGAGGSGSGEQVVCWGNSDDASTTMDTDGACHSGLVIALCAAGGAATENNRAYLKQWDTDGFTLTWDAAGTNRLGYVVIKGGRWRAGELTLNTTAVNNTATVSGLAFQPVGVEFMGRRSAEQSLNVAATQDVLSWGCASSTSSRRAMGCWDENATADSEVNLVIEYDGVLAYPTNAGAIDAVYDLNAINSDGFQLIVDDAPGTGNSAEWIGWLAFSGAAAGALEGPVGTSSETDTSLGLAKKKTKALGLSSGTNTALALTAVKKRSVGLCTETVTAFALSKKKNRATGLASAANSSLNLGRIKYQVFSLSAETDTAFALTGLMLRLPGISEELSTAYALSKYKTKALGISSETDAALALSPVKIGAVSFSVETGTTLTISRVKSKSTGLGAEVDSSLGNTPLKARSVGICAEANLAFALGRRKLLDISISEETGTAFGLTTVNILSIENDSSLALGRIKLRSVGLCESGGTPVVTTEQGNFSTFGRRPLATWRGTFV